MKNRSKCLNILLLTSSALMLAGCKEKGESGGRQSDEQLETFTVNRGNDRNYNRAYFANPHNRYRVLPVNNDSPLSPYGCSTSMVDRYAENGYGGVVTNVAWGDQYLVSDQAWELLEEVVAYTIDTKKMRVMIYDEDVYPSGGARQLTLSATPEGENWEAQGLVRQMIPCTKNEPVTLPSLYGHDLHLCFFYPGTNTGALQVKDPVKVNPVSGSTFIPEEDGYLACLFHKQFYEGTHFQYNLL